MTANIAKLQELLRGGLPSSVHAVLDINQRVVTAPFRDKARVHSAVMRGMQTTPQCRWRVVPPALATGNFFGC